MKKLIMIGCLACVMVLGILLFAPWSLPTASADTVSYPVTGGSITFDTTTGTVTGFTGSPTTVTIPETIDGVGVTSIGVSAFSNCESLTSISMPASIVSLDGGAFWFCSGLTSINIPDNVTSIGKCTFLGCTGLTSTG